MDFALLIACANLLTSMGAVAVLMEPRVTVLGTETRLC
jgi:hypothetical protein